MAKRLVFLVMMMMMDNRYIFHTLFGIMLNCVEQLCRQCKIYIFHATCAIVCYGKQDVNCFLKKKCEKFASKISRKYVVARGQLYFTTVPFL